jgi:very-short-patch-repair endonuclease
MNAQRLNRAIRKIAGSQYGALSAAQALNVGGTRAALQQRLRRGDIEAVADGVYVLPGAARCWRQKLWIALLEAGEGGVVGGRAAPALWGVPGYPQKPVEVLALHGRKNHRLTVGKLHETRSLPPHHVRRIDGIPVPCIERVLFMLAGIETYKRAERATDNALTARLTTPERLWKMWGELAGRGRPGTRAMRAILAERLPGYVAPASELEARFRDLLRDNGLQQPERQVDLGGEGWVGRVDCYFRPRIIVELDGRVGHVSELDRAKDRQRINELTAAGFAVIQFTWMDLVMRPQWVLSVLRGALATAA